MVFGIVIKPYMLIAGGSALFLLMVFQVLQGLRKIKFKGKLHLTVHKWTAFVLLAAAVIHGLLALAHFSII